MKNKIIILLAVMLGILTSYLVYDYLNDVERALSNMEYGEVVVAVGDIAPKTVLRPEHLEVKEMPVEYIHPAAISRKDEAVGAVTKDFLVSGEQLLARNLGKANDTQNGLAYIIPAGMRAITVPVDEVSGVAGLIKPGDKVDVVATVEIDDGQSTETTYSLVILQNIQVLAAGKKMEDDPESKNQTNAETITLAVSVEQSRPLVLANQKGTIRLMLRSPADNNVVDTLPFKKTDFLH